MEPTDILGNIKLYNADCMEVMKTFKDKQFSLAIVDPPYGIGADKKNSKRELKSKKSAAISSDFGGQIWDSAIPDKEYFDELFRVSKNQIIWGGNYFPLPPTKHFIFWDKLVAEGLSFSDGEMAWTSFDRAIRKFTLRNNLGGKIHPTEKPVALYRWLLHNYANAGDKIIDTHFGSLNIGLACHDYGYELTACEVDDEYYANGVKRLKYHQSQLTMF